MNEPEIDEQTRRSQIAHRVSNGETLENAIARTDQINRIVSSCLRRHESRSPSPITTSNQKEI